MKKFILAGASFLLPMMAFAQAGPTLGYVDGALQTIGGLVGTATPVVIGLAMLFFLYGLMKFILSAGDEEKRTEGKNIMIWGIVALFVMVSVWGLVRLLNTNLNVQQGQIPTVPAVP